MRRSALAITFAAALSVFTVPARGQYQPPSEKCRISARAAATWTGDDADVVQLEGPVTIELDRATLSAERAVLWLSPQPGAPRGVQRLDIVLLGSAEVAQGEAVRSGQQLRVAAVVGEAIEIAAEQRSARDLSASDLYRDALRLRNDAPDPQPAITGDGPGPAADPHLPAPPPAGDPAATAPPTAGGVTVPPGSLEPVRASYGQLDTEQRVDGKVVAVLSGGVTLLQRRKNGDFIELQAERVVVFTPLESLRDVTDRAPMRAIEDAVTAAYLEGDVRITYTPAAGGLGEQRFRARRVYYEFATDRAILTDAVVHTVEPQKQVPVVMRAKTVRQLSLGEFRAGDVELTTSTFRLPSYSIAADKVYVRQADTGDPRLGDRVTFRAENATFESFGVPLFFLPRAGGSMTDNASPLRGAGIENSRRYGVGVRTQWGLFETLGQVAPQDLDATYRLEYLGDRGPAFGLDATYRGGFVTDTAKERWSFEGDVTSYFVYDHGFDSFGRLDTREDADASLRGHALWEHQHFFPDDWQAQLRAGYVSDPTFLEAWFPRDFNRGNPHDVSAYLKRQRQTEAFTVLLQFQPNNLVTVADLMQEQFEVERLPEVGYHRIGDGFDAGDDSFFDGVTFFSNNTASAVRFNPTGATPREQGFPEDFRPGPGLPSLGWTGVTGDPTYRADFRQEIDFPFSAGGLRVVPFLVGRYTAYSDSPVGDPRHRLFAGAGARATTSFWRTDDNVRSKLLDLHRLRHVVTPEVNAFAAGTNVERGNLYIYDEPVDAITDASAVQLALRQRFQTQRGAPGRRRSVDVLTLNLEANFFANQPPEEQLRPLGFRGLFFASLPEASVPRNSVNADAAWRVTDQTVVLSDAQYNLERGTLATASVGAIVRRGERMTYFVGTRYIAELNSNIASVFVEYELTRKYSLGFLQNFDFGRNENVATGVELRRRFDTFVLTFAGSYSQADEQSGFSVNLSPTGLGYSVGSGLLQDAFEDNR